LLAVDGQSLIRLSGPAEDAEIGDLLVHSSASSIRTVSAAERAIPDNQW
jgi:hypothetical protein